MNRPPAAAAAADGLHAASSMLSRLFGRRPHPASRRPQVAVAAALFATFGTVVAASSDAADAYPDHTIHLVVGYSAGGGVDAVARLLAPRLSALLGQQIVVDNRTGATGTIAATTVAQSKPDGYTLLLGDSSTLIAPYLQKSLSFDPPKSFVPVAGTFTLPLFIVANNDFPAKDPSSLVAALKAQPGHYSFATSGVGTVHHLGFALFEQQAGVTAVHVPYRGAAQILPDVISGQVALGVVSATAGASLAKSGKLKALATMSAERLKGSEDVAPLAVAVPGFDAVPRLFLAAPAGTPKAVVDQLADAAQKVLSAPDLPALAAQQGAVPAYLAPEPLARSLREESVRWGALIRDNHISTE